MRERTYEIKIEGVPIIVTKKRMKNMYLRISKEDGTVRISAPHQMSDARDCGICQRTDRMDTEISAEIQRSRRAPFGKPGTGCGGNCTQKETAKA